MSFGTAPGHRYFIGERLNRMGGMVEEANRSGSYTWPVNGQTLPRIQLATVAQLLRNEVPKMPPVLPPYLKAARHAVPLDQLTIEG